MTTTARASGGPEYGPLLAAARALLDSVAAADAPDDVVRTSIAHIQAASAALAPHGVIEQLAPAGRRPDLPRSLTMVDHVQPADDYFHKARRILRDDP